MYRPVVPPTVHHQLCPVCMAPHFPFCTPVHPYTAPPAPQELHYPGKLASHVQYDAFHPLAGQPFVQATHAGPDPGFKGGNAPHPTYFPHGHPSHFSGDRRDMVSHVSRGQFQSADSFYPREPQFYQPTKQNFISNGSMDVDFSRQGRQNSWADVERELVLQQQQRAAGVGDRLGSAEGFQSNMHACPGGDTRFEVDIAQQSFPMGSFAGVAKARNQSGPAELLDSHHISLTSAVEVRESKGLAMNPADFPNYTNSNTGSDIGGSQAPKAFRTVPGQLHVSDGFASGEGALPGCELDIHQNAKREDDLPHGCLPAETCERRGDPQEGMAYALPKKILKRKHPMTREEELLIEKGLLDEDLSEPYRQERSLYLTQQGNEHFVIRSNQGSLKEDDIHYRQLGLRSSTAFSERESNGANFGPMGEHASRRGQPPMAQSERNREVVVTDKSGDGKHPHDWPSQGSFVKNVPWDVPTDGTKSLSLENLCSGVSHPFRNQPSNLYRQQFEEAEMKKEILYRQYQEWEAEEQHMEALRRAERLAREIQQREEGVHLSSSVHFPHSLQHQEMSRSGSAEPISPASMVQKASYQQGGSAKQPSFQHSSHYADREGYFQEPQNQEQSRGGFAHDQHNAQAYVRLHSLQDGLTQRAPSAQPWQKTLLSERETSHEQSSQHPDWSKEHQSGYKPPHYNQRMSHNDQQSILPHSYNPHLGAKEPLQKLLDRSVQHGSHHQPTSHDLHGNNPPLPVTGSVYPAPPDSPPPPLPPTLPPEMMTPPPPPSATISAPPRPSTLQDSLGRRQDYPQQILHQDGHYHGPSEPHRSEISQTHMSNLWGFQPLAPHQVDKSKVIDAINLFRNPARQSRPERFVVILRGLPGSGKSHLAKALRDVEVMNGGSAPRIHSMDDYFTCEVEKEEEVEMGSSSLRSKKKIVKRVVEYCYESEMEEAYRASMLKAFRKTLEEGLFKFVIVDDRNVLIADFAQFWATAKRSGYEAFVLEAPYNDVKGCAARNVHNFTEQQIQSMADRWESTPSLYLKLEVSNLFRADDLNAQEIIEVDMDADDMERDLEDDDEETNLSLQDHLLSSQSIERPLSGDRWGDKNDMAEEPVMMSKSNARSERHRHAGGRGSKGRSTDNALSGLMTTYGKKDKSVRWSDSQGVKGSSSTGFSIGASQKAVSLVIGPGPGYNGVSNVMVVEDDDGTHTQIKRNRRFVEQLRAEQEAFKAVFVRRRQRIRGMDEEDDDQ